MYQTFYIDIDEEISSVIDKLNKSMAGDNYFVVPKRALFLQSIVNLKLLKREADKIGKRVVIVTQDNIGISMAERAGISTIPSLESLEQNSESSGSPYEENAHVGGYEGEGDMEDDGEASFLEENMNKSSRLNNVGSEDYYNDSEKGPDDNKRQYEKKSSMRSEAVKPDVPARKLFGIKGYSNASGSATQQSKVYQTVDTRRVPYQGSGAKTLPETAKRQSQYKKQLDPYKERALEKIFSKNRENDYQPKPVEEKKRGAARKISIAFGAVCALSLAGVSAYLFIPSAKIIITPNNVENRVNMNVNGSGSPSGESMIPIRVINKEESVSLEIEMQGKSVSGQKAKGNVTIYNEFSNVSQPLVATTRLESPDGKIFRLIKGVTVPGTTTVEGETKPGAIEVQVVADQPGADFNIGSTDFTIPGFKDGPKYEKFYAKSTESMTGGASDGSASGPASVKQADIDKAKEKAKEALKEKIAETIKGELAEGEISLEEAQEMTMGKISVSARVGQVLSSFDCSATASFKAMIFFEDDVMKIIEKSVKDKESSEYEWKIAGIEYATVQPDFEKPSLELKIHGEVAATPVIDADRIKNEILGKKADELGDVLRKYSFIKNVNVEFQPIFISRVPQYGKRVSVEIVEAE